MPETRPDAKPAAPSGVRAPVTTALRNTSWPIPLHRLGRVLADAVFPRRCAACRCYGIDQAGIPAAGESPPEWAPSGTWLEAIFQRGLGRFLCPDCLADVAPTASPLCCRCGVMFVSREGEDHLCGHCLQQAPPYGRARAAGVYSGGLMALVHHVKYRGCLALVDPLASLLRDAFGRYWPPDDIDLVLPIPLHAGRLRRRGFNQAQLLSDAWSRAERSEGHRGLRFPKARRILIRSRATLPQTGLGKAERRRNMRGAFTVLDARVIAGRRILLVDDVYTTGATAGAAARALMRNGAESVDVLTVARTMPNHR